MVGRVRLEMRCGRVMANTEAHGCRKAGVNCRLAIKQGKYRCIAHEVFEIVAGLAMGRTAMRTIVPRLQADLEFSAGFDTFTSGPMYVGDIEVMPDNPHTVAISRRRMGTPASAGVGIYDDGVVRSNTTLPSSGNDSIDFGSSPFTIYGFDNESSGFGFSILTVDANGVNETKTFTNSPLGFFGTWIKYSGGRIYSNLGAVVNPDTGTLLGKFGYPYGPGLLFTASGLAPDADLGRTFLITPDPPSCGHSITRRLLSSGF